MREWFTIAELRVARVPTFSEDFFQALSDDCRALPANLYRFRARLSPFQYDREFHLSAFMQSEQVALTKYYSTADLKRWFRIAELRAAAIPEYFIEHLKLVHPNLSPIEGRNCPVSGEPEFAIRLFSKLQRRRLFRRYLAGVGRR